MSRISQKFFFVHYLGIAGDFRAIASVEKIVKQDSCVQSFDQPDNKKKFNNRGQNTNPVYRQKNDI